MSLPVPSSTDLDTFSHDETAQFSEDQKESALEQASDLLFIATGYDEVPTDARTVRFIKYGLMDMAWSLLVRTANKSEIYAPFSSERIGSYSYSKASQQITNGSTTGIDWFDRVVKYLGDIGLADQFSVYVGYSSEVVFPQPFQDDVRSPSPYFQG